MRSNEKEFSPAAVDGPPGYAGQGGYPPQQGGYPPQQGGYPQQQGGYPQQPAGYPQGQPGGAVVYGQGHTTVVVQGGAYAGPPPKDFLAFSIITLICFNLIFGIIALICSIQTRDEANRGNLDEAKRKSKCALGWNVAAVVISVLCVIIVCVYFYVIVPMLLRAAYG